MSEAGLSTQFSSREVEALLSVPRPTLLGLASRLPVTRHGHPGKGRLWTSKDIAVAFFALRFSEAGMSQSASASMAAEAERHFERIMAEDEKSGPTFLVTTLATDGTGYEFAITNEPGDAVARLARGLTGVVVFNITDMLKSVFLLILHFEKAKKGEGNA